MEDYRNSAVRHFADAETLFAAGKLDNSGHLMGFAAECAIKYRISTLRLGNQSPHGHLPELLVAARKHLGPRSAYTSMFNLLKSDILKGWNVNRRYWATGNTQAEEFAAWHQETKRLLAAAGVKGRI